MGNDTRLTRDIRHWPWTWIAKEPERKKFKDAPFSLKDNDGPSHLWIIAYMLEDKHGLEATADNLRRHAEQWAKERAINATAEGATP